MANTLNKESNASPREAEGRRTTSIRPVSLRRANLVTTIVGSENITDFISNATDDKAKRLVKKHAITLPAELAFSGDSTTSAQTHKL